LWTSGLDGKELNFFSFTIFLFKVYATDTKQNVYTRIGISATDRVGTAWKLIEGKFFFEESLLF